MIHINENCYPIINDNVFLIQSPHTSPSVLFPACLLALKTWAIGLSFCPGLAREAFDSSRIAVSEARLHLTFLDLVLGSFCRLMSTLLWE